MDGDDGEMGEEAREDLGASQLVGSLHERHFSGSREPLEVFEQGSDLISHMSGE